MIRLFIRTLLRSRSFWCVVVTLTLIEATLAVGGTRLSLDVRHLRAAPEIISKLAASPGSPVLVIGSSIVREGVSDFQSTLREQGIECADAAVVHPDDSSILEWYHLYERFVSRQWAQSGVVVLGFAADHLEDQIMQFEEVHRLSQWHGPMMAPRLAFRNGLDFSTGADLFLASSFSAYSMRQRVQRRLLAATIPHYRTTAQLINEQMRRSSEVRSAGSTHYLEALLEQARDDRVRLVFVAFPLKREYEIDPRIRELISRSGHSLIDMRSTAGITAASFKDEIHMNAHGARTFTAQLASRLSEDVLGPSFCEE